MKKAIFIILCSIFAAIFYGCDEFIEKDIEGKSITILAPADNIVTPHTSITFWWEEIEGALDYNVQVVSPSFDMVQKLWADTFVVGNKFNLALIPGAYQWRIRGLNGSSATRFFTASFAIDSSRILDPVVLRSPSNNTMSNNLSHIFKWDKQYNADQYQFRITNSSGSDTTLIDETTRNTEIAFKFTDDGTYKWSVRGQNEISNSRYSSFTITIDTKSPGIPTLKSPEDKSFWQTDTVRFEWKRVEDTGSPLFDSLYVFRDSTLTNKALSKKINNTFYKDTLKAGITYYWYVKTCDEAGNVGEKSSTFRFTKNF